MQAFYTKHAIPQPIMAPSSGCAPLGCLFLVIATLPGSLLSRLYFPFIYPVRVLRYKKLFTVVWTVTFQFVTFVQQFIFGTFCNLQSLAVAYWATISLVIPASNFLNYRPFNFWLVTLFLLFPIVGGQCGWVFMVCMG